MRSARPALAAGLLGLGAGASAIAGVAVENFITIDVPSSRATAVGATGELGGVFTEHATGRVGAFTALPGFETRVLGSLGGLWTEIAEISATGSAVGWGFAEGLAATRAFVFTPSTGVRTIPGLEHSHSEAAAINRNGQIAGSFDVGGAMQAFRFSPGAGVQALGALAPGDLAWSWGADINAAGQVVGWSFTPSGEVAAFRYTSVVGMQRLAGFGGGFSQALAISDTGHVVGWSKDTAGRLRAFHYSDGRGVRDLGDLGGGVSCATGVNDAGAVVGWSLTAYGAEHAFVWTEETGMLDLAMLVGAAHSYRFEAATDISASGDVAGFAVPLFDGATQPVAVRVTLNLNATQRGDLNGDGRVNVADLSLMLVYLRNGDSRGDLNGDQLVNYVDIAALLGDWTG